ncbi:MAG: hypothetical protein QXY45_04440 [Candidatus Aenigmatarchaeota archaeon]
MEEKMFVINLKKHLLRTPSIHRSKRATKIIKEYLLRHTKVKEVKISDSLNKWIWRNGDKNLPTKIKLKVMIDEDMAEAELWGYLSDVSEEKKEKEESTNK